MGGGGGGARAAGGRSAYGGASLLHCRGAIFSLLRAARHRPAREGGARTRPAPAPTAAAPSPRTPAGTALPPTPPGCCASPRGAARRRPAHLYVCVRHGGAAALPSPGSTPARSPAPCPPPEDAVPPGPHAGKVSLPQPRRRNPRGRRPALLRPARRPPPLPRRPPPRQTARRAADEVNGEAPPACGSRISESSRSRPPAAVTGVAGAGPGGFPKPLPPHRPPARRERPYCSAAGGRRQPGKEPPPSPAARLPDGRRRPPPARRSQAHAAGAAAGRQSLGEAEEDVGGSPRPAAPCPAYLESRNGAGGQQQEG